MRVDSRTAPLWLAAGLALAAPVAPGEEAVSAELLEFLGAMSPDEGDVVALLEESALWADLEQQASGDPDSKTIESNEQQANHEHQ